MKVSELIINLAESIMDSDRAVFSDLDWLGIIAAQSGELYPEIAPTTSTVIPSSAYANTYQVDMSSTTTYPGLQRVKTVSLVDLNGKRYKYSNWSFDLDTKRLDLQRGDALVSEEGITGFPNVEVTWLYVITPDALNSELGLQMQEIDLLKKICIKESISRILMDHIKLDRYRTLYGRSNEYALIAIRNQIAQEVDVRKKRIVRTLPIKSF